MTPISQHQDQSRDYRPAPRNHLILILENEAGKGYSYLLLDPQISRQLLKKCSESKGEKKINPNESKKFKELLDVPIKLELN